MLIEGAFQNSGPDPRILHHKVQFQVYRVAKSAWKSPENR